jgi:glycoside/pentoside/hexuronide:cation symporter, GPH family
MSYKSTPKGGRPLITLLAYSLPVGGVAFLLLPSGTVLQDIYPKYYGLNFAAIGTAYFICNILVAVLNPVVGMVSDRLGERGITHRVCALIGFALFVYCSYRLFTPPRNVDAGTFTFWLICMRLSWMVFDAPHLAWGADLANSYEARIQLFGIRNGIVSVGAACFYALPLLPAFSTHDFTPETLRLAAVIGLIYSVPAIGSAICFVPGARLPCSPLATSVDTSSTRKDVRAILSNKPFLILVCGSVCLGMGEDMWMTLSTVIFDYYYGLAHRFSMMYLCGTVLAALSVPLLIRLSTRWGKKRMFIILNCGFLVLITIRTFVRPGPSAVIPLSIVLTGVFAVLIFKTILIQALLADVADYGRWKFGKAQEATYFAAFYFFNFVLGSAGGPIGLVIVDRMGFAPHGISNMAEAKMAIELVFYIIPAFMTAIGLAFVWKIPICARRAAAIRSRIERRARWLSAHA